MDVSMEALVAHAKKVHEGKTREHDKTKLEVMQEDFKTLRQDEQVAFIKRAMSMAGLDSIMFASVTLNDLAFDRFKVWTTRQMIKLDTCQIVTEDLLTRCYSLYWTLEAASVACMGLGVSTVCLNWKEGWIARRFKDDEEKKDAFEKRNFETFVMKIKGWSKHSVALCTFIDFGDLCILLATHGQDVVSCVLFLMGYSKGAEDDKMKLKKCYEYAGVDYVDKPLEWYVGVRFIDAIPGVQMYFEHADGDPLHV
jgi:hypothetical protein